MAAMHTCAALVLAAIAFSLALPAKAQSDLPEGSGKPVVEKVCSGCHALSVFSESRASGDHWEAVVDDMVSRGAEGTDAEIEQIISYLAKNFGPLKVNVNRAAAAELAKALAISKENAAAIVEYRAKNGDFKNLEALENVPGIDAKRIAEKKDWIEF